METREFNRKEIEAVEVAVRSFLDGDLDGALAFLRANREEVSEFCLLVQDAYSANDRTTPVIQLSRLISALL